MSDQRKAIIRTTHNGVAIELEVHPEDVGTALDSMAGTVRRVKSRGGRRGSRPDPEPAPAGSDSVQSPALPSTSQVREYIDSHRLANVSEIGRALMNGLKINAQKDKPLYDAIYIRLSTARKQLGRARETPRSSEARGGGSPASPALSSPPPNDEEAAIKAVSAVTTEAAVQYVKAHPRATMKEFAPEVVGMELRLSGSTATAYKIASNKLWYARKKLGIKSPIPAVGGRK